VWGVSKAMLTKKHFLEEKKKLEDFIAQELTTIDNVNLNLIKIRSALSAVEKEIERFSKK
jgi:hypothetical protein